MLSAAPHVLHRRDLYYKNRLAFEILFCRLNKFVNCFVAQSKKAYYQFDIG